MDPAIYILQYKGQRPMNLTDFKQSVHHEAPPHDMGSLLQALWYDAKGDWDSAHNLAQEVHSKEGAWIHAYLHRKEGDLGNASYWYHRADRQLPKISLDEEWDEIAGILLP